MNATAIYFEYKKHQKSVTLLDCYIFAFGINTKKVI